MVCWITCRYASKSVFRSGVRTMDHWRLAYLGMRHFPHELTEFEVNTLFT